MADKKEKCWGCKHDIDQCTCEELEFYCENPVLSKRQPEHKLFNTISAGKMLFYVVACLVALA